jgi:hypothetical protein
MAATGCQEEATMAKKKKPARGDSTKEMQLARETPRSSELATLLLQTIRALQPVQWSPTPVLPAAETFQMVHVLLTCQLSLVLREGSTQGVTLALMERAGRLDQILGGLHKVRPYLAGRIDLETHAVLIKLATCWAGAGIAALRRYLEKAGRPDLSQEAAALAVDDWVGIFSLLLWVSSRHRKCCV